MASRWSALGPGLLFAATAVGVSHLVQATRAGAQAGLGMAGLVLLAHAIKYPAFRIGHDYPAATGQSLLQAYRRQGRWALILYGLVTLGTMFTVQAAVTLVTVGLLLALVDVRMDPVTLSVILLVCSALFLAVGRFSGLDRLTRVLVGVLSIATVTAAALVVPRVDFGSLGFGLGAALDPARAAFVVGFVGWMPTAPDVSVWQSLWVRAKAREGETTPAGVRLDFHVGYATTLLLALAFLVLGAGVLHGGGELPARPVSFCRRLLDVYTEALGPWARPVVGVAALAAMASTTLAVLDGFPRALSGLYLRWSRDEDDEAEEATGAAHQAYWIALGLLCAGALGLIGLFLTSLRALVDVATVLSFLSAPVLCWLNHRAAFGPEGRAQVDAPRWLRGASGVGIVAHLALAACFLVA